jgi:hypothetical protein
MEIKEKRGMMIAATRKIALTGNLYFVPASLTGDKVFQVDLATPTGKCTCPENRRHEVLCEHIYAAKYFRKREEEVPADTKTNESKSTKKPRKTYHQNWPLFNEC